MNMGSYTNGRHHSRSPRPTHFVTGLGLNLGPSPLRAQCSPSPFSARDHSSTPTRSQSQTYSREIHENGGCHVAILPNQPSESHPFVSSCRKGGLNGEEGVGVDAGGNAEVHSLEKAYEVPSPQGFERCISSSTKQSTNETDSSSDPSSSHSSESVADPDAESIAQMDLMAHPHPNTNLERSFVAFTETRSRVVRVSSFPFSLCYLCWFLFPFLPTRPPQSIPCHPIKRRQPSANLSDGVYAFPISCASSFDVWRE